MHNIPFCYFYAMWHFILFALMVAVVRIVRRATGIHMSPLFAVRPGVLLTAVVSLNVETAAILTAAAAATSMLSTSGTRINKRTRVVPDGRLRDDDQTLSVFLSRSLFCLSSYYSTSQNRITFVYISESYWNSTLSLAILCFIDWQGNICMPDRMYYAFPNLRWDFAYKFIQVNFLFATSNVRRSKGPTRLNQICTTHCQGNFWKIVGRCLCNSATKRYMSYKSKRS